MIKIENGKHVLDSGPCGRHNGVDIKIGRIYKNLDLDRLRLEIQSFLEYSIGAFYTT